MHAETRMPAVAGLFYPGTREELDTMLERFLDLPEPAEAAPKAVIAPHAGYVYSGPIAASAYIRLRRVRDTVQRVVQLGPSHRVGFHGLAASSARWFHTPLGDVPVDRAALEQVLQLPQVQMLDQAHLEEHSLEVHLPFLQRVLGDFSLVPLVVGESAPEQVGEVLEQLWGGPETLIVISSDLSHYLPYDNAREIDARTSEAIAQLRYEDLRHDQACGRNPVSGLLYVARRKGLHGRVVDLRNSGDTAGSKDRVVGYGAYVFQ